MIDIPQSKASGKNSADIHMVVDALDLCYAKQHIDIFALLSGDSDFSPLVSKLKENDKRVIGCGVKSSTSNLLIAACDEFIYYDDLIREVAAEPRPRRRSKRPKKETDKKQEAVDRLVKIVQSLELDYDPLWGSMVKQAIRRVYPDFNEGYYGYRNFSDLLEEARTHGPDRTGARRGPRQLQSPAAERLNAAISGCSVGQIVVGQQQRCPRFDSGFQRGRFLQRSAACRARWR